MKREFMRMISLLFFLVALECYSSNVETKHETIVSGNWTISFDREHAVGISLLWKGKELTRSGNDIPVDLQLERGKWSGASNKYEFADFTWDAATATLSLNYKCSKLELSDIYKFGDSGKNARVRRSMKIKYLKGKEPVKFFAARLTTVIPKRGKYFFPAYPFDLKRRGVLDNLQNGFKHTSIWGCGPLMVEDAFGRSILFINDARRDAAKTDMEVAKDSVRIQSRFWASGWLWPGKAQTITFAYIDVDEGGIRKNFKTQIWKWFKDVEIKVPEDRPDWVYDARMYYFPATNSRGGYDIDGTCKGLVEARKKLLPKIKWMGFNTLWVKPLEDRLGYWPRNYFKFHPSAGEPKDFKDFVKSAHSMGLRVLQDIVPHGGTPYFGELRGNSPFSLCFDESGNPRGYWCFDLLDPEWREYMRKIATHHIQEFGHDGFRIDACAGTRNPNWRRKGFPVSQKTPAHVSSAWWSSALKKVGGETPPLPYERASFAIRKGGLEMIKTIRQAVRSVKKDGVVLAETQHSPYMQETDIIYDAELDVYQWEKLLKMPREQFVSGLQELFEEQKYAEPQGTYRMRFVGCHDRYTPRGWLGDDAYKALNAIVWGIECMPMLYYKNEALIGSFLKKLNNARESLPELRRGNGFYTVVSSSDGKVFTCLRTLGELTTLVCVNLQDAPTRPTLRFDSLFNPRSETICVDALSGKSLDISQICGSVVLTPELGAWQAAYYRLGELKPPPPSIELSAVSTKKTALTMRVVGDALHVETKRYSLDLRSGLIARMLAEDGTLNLSEGKFILNNASPSVSSKLLKLDQAKHQAVYRVSLPENGIADISYTFTPEKVLMNAELSSFKELKTRVAGFTFKFANPARYCVSTASGVVDEPYFVSSLFQAGRAERQYLCYTRPYFCNEYIWQNMFHPLSPSQPVVAAFNKTAGVRMTFGNPLSGDYDNIALLEDFNGGKGLFLACLWVHNSLPGDLSGRKREFKLEITPEKRSWKLERRAPLFACEGDVAVSNNGLGWTLENKHYKIELSKAGGLLKRFLWKTARREALSGSEISTRSGFRNNHNAKVKVFAEVGRDGQTGVAIKKKRNGFLISFNGVLSTGRMGVTLPQPIWYKTQYYVDSSPILALRWSVMSDGRPFDDDKKDITGEFRLADGLSLLSSKKPGVLNKLWNSESGYTDLTPGGVLNYSWKNSDNGPLSNECHSPGFECWFAGASGSLPKLLRGNRKSIKFFWLDPKEPENFKAQKWYSVRLAFGEGITSKNIPVDIWGDLKNVRRDNDYTIPKHRILLPTFNETYAWHRPHSGGIAYQKCKVFNKDTLCVKLDSKFFKEKHLYKKLLNLREYPAKTKLDFSAVVKGNAITPRWSGGVFRIKFELANGRSIRSGLSHLDGTYDWTKVVFSAMVPRGARRAYIEIGMDSAVGQMWFCDVDVKKKGDAND